MPGSASACASRHTRKRPPGFPDDLSCLTIAPH
jgi:hypothetical protein